MRPCKKQALFVFCLFLGATAPPGPPLKSAKIFGERECRTKCRRLRVRAFSARFARPVVSFDKHACQSKGQFTTQGVNSIQCFALIPYRARHGFHTTRCADSIQCFALINEAKLQFIMHSIIYDILYRLR